MYERCDDRMIPAEADIIDVGSMLSVLWWGKWIIMITSILAGALAAWLSLQLPNRYASSAQLLIDPTRSQVIGLSEMDILAPPNELLIESKSYLARSPEVLETVVARLNLNKNEEFLNSDTEMQAKAFEITGEALQTRIAMKSVNQALTIRPIGTSSLIEIRAETFDPHLSAAIANTTAEVFMEVEMRRKREENEFANDWILERVGELQDRVTQSASTMEMFRLQSGNVTELDLSELSRRLDRVQERVAVAKANGRPSETLLAELERTDNELRRMTDQVIRQQQLEQKALADQMLYERLLTRAGELQESATFQAADGVIVSRALPPLERSGPNRKLITLLGAILGGAGGVLIAVGLAMRRGLRTAERRPA